ncbi:MAG: pantetheine-phosphate adenylyltransferase [Clostridia bacterium]|nr:pantetheine-phosphate adenylyltransferase [Clostridia bacterium]
MRTALVPGSFDPITLGHVSVIERSSLLFDKVIVCVMLNEHKQYMFSLSERAELVKDAVAHLKNVQVDTWDGMLWEYAQKQEVCAIVKGVRNGKDTDYELPQAYFNSQKYPQALTVFLPAEENKAQISSTLVRNSVQDDTDYRQLVPQKVYEAVMKKKRGI